MKSLPFILTTLIVSTVALMLSLLVLAFVVFWPSDQADQAGQVASEVDQPAADEQLLTLPDSDQGGPWPINAYAKSNSPIREVKLTKHLPKKHRFIGLTVSEQNSLAVATFMDSTEQDKYDTYALTIDLAHGKVQSKWSVPDFTQPISINSDGTKVLFWRTDGVNSGREILYVGQRKSTHEDFELSQWQPFEKEGAKPGNYDKSIRVKWASFVGQRVVAVNEEGRLLVFDKLKGKVLKQMSGVEGFPTLTPDQKKVVFVLKQNVLLFNPSELAITHALTLDEIPEHPILSVDPLAKKLLIAGTGKAIVVRLDDLSCNRVQIDKLETKGQRITPDLAWFGNSLFFYNDQLFDFDSPMPVWRLGATDELQLVGDSLWGITNNGRIDATDYKLQRFELDATRILSEIRQAYQTSDVIPFRSGDSVRIDVSELPLEHRENARTALQQSLKQAGYIVAPTAKVKAVAKLGELVDSDITYQYGRDSKTFDYRRQSAELSIEKDGKRLWGQAKTHSPPGCILKDRLEDKAVVAKWGKPDFSVYAGKIPTFMLHPGSTGYLGRTYLGRAKPNLPQIRPSIKAKSTSSSRTNEKSKRSVGSSKEVFNPFVK